MKLGAVVLAAGYGKLHGRSKVLADLDGQPMICRILDNLNQACLFSRFYIVVNEESGQDIRQALKKFSNVTYVTQQKRCGSAGATKLALKAMEPGTRHTLVAFGDMPLWKRETFRQITNRHLALQPQLTMVSIPLVKGTRPERYGRILRDAKGKILRTIEPWQIKPDQPVKAGEVNPSLYAAESKWLEKAIDNLEPVNKGDGFPDEYLLQDVIHVASEQDAKVAEIRIDEIEQALGVNDEQELREVRTILKRQTCSEMAA